MKKRHKLHYNPDLKRLARELRKNMTLGEVLLWNCLKNKQMKGYDFHRQRPIDNYIIDFYCGDLMLAIEIDGGSHDYKYEEDVERQNRLEGLGIRFLRFNECDIKNNLEVVLSSIEDWIKKN